jgi:hypothetical protein
MQRSDNIWLVIRAIGVNVIAFGLIEASYVVEYAIRLVSLSSAVSETSGGSAPSYYTWLLGWAIVRLALHAALGLYLLVAGESVYRLIAHTLGEEHPSETGTTPN